MIFLFEINHLTSVKISRGLRKKQKTNKQRCQFFFCQIDVDPPPPPPPPPMTKISGTAHGSRQPIGMTTVHLGVVCKLIFAFLPENIGVGAR